MGVPGLWKELAPAAQVRSLTELAVVDGFEANLNGRRGFRIGIDASIWFFHANYGREGENPELRTLFFRCATLMHAPFLPLFVFDGPHRPAVKRGKKIRRESHKLTNGMKGIVEAFGFEWITAPGEAEAELAYLNRIGVLDGILSDDVDNFLFGATTVIRNPSNNLSGNRANPVLNSDGRDDKNHVRVYNLSSISTNPAVSLTRGDMILIGLCSGGDYDTSGWSNCGPTTAKALVRYGFGKSLYEAGKNLPRDQLPAFLHTWRKEVKHELLNDTLDYIGSNRRALAASLPDTFPDIDILLYYINPLTSESAGRSADHLKKPTWDKEPDLGKLAETCESYFEWGYRDIIVKRFRTVIWPGAVQRILRRGVLEIEDRRLVPPATPSKWKNGKEVVGTPSKMIAEKFSSLSLDTRSLVRGAEDEEDDRILTKITRSRQHASTDEMLEYRLEVLPGLLVRMTEAGVKGTRRPLDDDEWADLQGEPSDEDGGKKKKKPELTAEERAGEETKPVLLWMPASMVQLAEPGLVREFEEKEERKREKKAGKGKARPKKDEAKSVPSKAKGKAKAAPLSEDEEDGSDSDLPPKAQTKSKPKAPPKKAPMRKTNSAKTAPPPPTAKARLIAAFPELSDLSSDEGEAEMPTFLPPPTKAVSATKKKKTDDQLAAPPVVRDLTKGKVKGNSAQKKLADFYPLERALSRKGASAPVAASSKAPEKENATLSAPTARRPGPDVDLRRVADLGKGKKMKKPTYVDISDSESDSRARRQQRKHRVPSSDDEGRINKSPRKGRTHTSPREQGVRQSSPSPRKGREVIEICSSSDEEMPPSSIVRTQMNEVIDISD
ncbi:hypothetical protein FB45DRAFT_915247 [Roridomyces roridus]|uniref:XPG-I domain-containing protein n=1 Tax=Roridomyces roridus TaxID=1738132 RepID=A0AAD7BTI6_9AGAR|nr:hypothetical protein FB45DRAFT_915247 [Roridomyces roridus]